MTSVRRRITGRSEVRGMYGIVWEKDDAESAALVAAGAPPTLTRVASKCAVVTRNSPDHWLIEGDNLLALTALQHEFAGAVDVIYIDPPYNTGKAREWRYNDRCIGKDDAFRHSAWLNFMNARLTAARTLLSDRGVIFISIDDNEQAQLKMLCDGIFGEHNFESFIWKKKCGAGNTEKIVGNLTEYILCYFVAKREGIFNYRDISREYKFRDERGPYNLEGIEKTNLGSYERTTMLFPIFDPTTGKKYLPGRNMRWTIGRERILEEIAAGRIRFDEKKRKAYLVKRPEDYGRSKNVYYNLLDGYGSLSSAKAELHEFFGNREVFDTPKPTELIVHLLEIASRKDSIVMDFFAGSGTTGEAVLRLNAMDGGSRRFLLAASDENGICRKVCHPRILMAMKGYRGKRTGKHHPPLGGTLSYFKVVLPRRKK